MTEERRDDDELLEQALAAFRGAPGAGAPPGVLVSLLERQGAAGRRRRGAPAWAAAVLAAGALLVGFWAGRSSVEPRGSSTADATAVVTESRGAAVPGAAVPGAAVPGAAVPGAAVPGAASPAVDPRAVATPGTAVPVVEPRGPATGGPAVPVSGSPGAVERSTPPGVLPKPPRIPFATA